MIQPMCEYQNPRSCAEWTSFGVSEYLWCQRWWPAHQSTPFWAAVCAPSASRNWNPRDVLYDRCEK